MLHPIQRRYFAEELVRQRRADEQQRFIASQRAGHIDANPHQIDAVIFALSRLPQGGCILADEVGLGKTIEAGLVMAQLRAEGAARILLITPKPLVGQWTHELLALFGIEAREGTGDLDGAGVFIVGREWAGSENGAARLQAAPPFSLCVIDEAHEVFSGIYRRFDSHGRLRDSNHARTAMRVRQILRGVPVLLLTATPIQNSLTELWGLVQYVEPTGSLFGDLGTFRALFCAGDDRRLRDGREDDLRRRLATVCQRTLRRQAQEFMKQPFRRRFARLFTYEMSTQERTLYEDVSSWLLDPKSASFGGAFRRLLIIGFHRRMASSQRALAASLRNVAERLRKRIAGVQGHDDTADLFADDLEIDPDDREEISADNAALVVEGEASRLVAELALVEGFIARADAIGADTKARQLVAACRLARERQQTGEGSGKVVIFTESLATQRYLREVLLSSGWRDGDITLFSGTNDGPRAREALRNWQSDAVSGLSGPRGPSVEVATRLALVHEFATRSSIMIATEAGAKGLNLQFCDTVINYDLPWNPQRIEQRIGRCHRYGQMRDVTVVNFLASDNAADRMLFDILSRKLDLFGTVLDASDQILHEAGEHAAEALVSAVGAELESQLRRVYEQARSAAEIEAGLLAVDAAISGSRTVFEDTYRRTAGLIETRFDESVRSAFRSLAAALPDGLAAFDRALESVVTAYAAAIGAPCTRASVDGGVLLTIGANPNLPEQLRAGVSLSLGSGDANAERLHLGHALVHAAVTESREATTGRHFRVRAKSRPAGWAASVRGTIVLVRLDHGGFEPISVLLPVVVCEPDGRRLPESDALALFNTTLEASERMSAPRVTPDAIDEAIEAAVFLAQGDIDSVEHAHFVEVLLRIERGIGDRCVVLARERADLGERRREAERRRELAGGADARNRAERALADLDAGIERCERALTRLRSGEDDEAIAWLQQAYARRYAPPKIERLFTADFTTP